MESSGKRPERRHIIVPAKELEAAMSVWLKVMPRHVWADYLKLVTADPKRHGFGDQIDPRDVLAAYMAGKFAQAGWQVSLPEPVPHTCALGGERSGG